MNMLLVAIPAAIVVALSALLLIARKPKLQEIKVKR